MNFAFSEEQEQLRDAVRRFMESKSPSAEVRRLMETTEGYDPAVWSQMAQELGLQSLHIPEAHGGQGFTFVELGIVLEEMGRVLLCAPYFATVALAANAIMNAGTDAQQGELLPGIASGETIAALGVHRAQRPVGRLGHHDGSERVGRLRGAQGHEDVRDRRTHRRHDRRGRAPGRDQRRGRHLVLRGRRRRRRTHPHSSGHDGPDPQAGPARVLRRRGQAAR